MALFSSGSVIVSAQSSSADEREIAGLILRTFDAFSEKDIQRLKESWSIGSEFESFKVEFATTHATGDHILFESPRFSRWSFDVGRASVRVAFAMSWRDKGDLKPMRQPLAWDFGLVREAGRWEIKTWDVPRAHLTERLLALPTHEEQLSFLHRERELLDASLVGTLIENGDRLAQEGEFDGGRRQVEAGCEIAETLNEAAALARCHVARGDLSAYNYRQSEALESYARALSLFTLVKDSAGRRAVLLRAGNAHLRRDEYDEALKFYEEALASARADGAATDTALALKQIGIANQSMGLYADALSSFEESVAVAKAARDDLALASAQINAGNIYFLVGKVAQAERAYSEGLRIYDELGDKSGEAGARINLGNYYRQIGEYDKALGQYEQSLAIGSQSGDRLVVLSSINGAGRVNLLRGNYDEARQEFERALATARDTGSREEEAGATLELGYLSVATGRDDEGLVQYKHAREIAALAGDADMLFRCDNFIGGLHLKHERWDEAAAAYRSAVGGVEKLRENTRIPSLQPGFFGQFTSPYRNLAWLAFRSGKAADAYEISERAKARTLVDIMRSGRVVTGAVTAAERSQEQAMLDKISGLESALDSLKADGSADAQPLKEQLASAYADYERLTTQLFLRHSELRAQRARFAPVGLEEVNRSLFTGRPGLRILSYLITEQGVLLLVLRPGNDGATVQLTSHLIKTAGGETGGKDLRAEVMDFRLKCSKPSGPYTRGAHRLYDMLVAPAADELKGATNLVIVPDGILHTLPFQALLDKDGKHLVERYGVSYAPSVTALREMVKLSDARRTRGSASGLLAMGVSTFGNTGRRHAQTLPWAGDQVKEVAALFGVRGYVEDAATEARAKSLMTRSRFIHFVTHGEVNQESPMFSTVVLKKGDGEDGLLYAREIAGLRLRAEMVTLAACETALGQETQGEGLLGLSWALFVAGAPSSVLTQWQVQDTSTNWLMVAFYRRLKETGFKNKAGAIQYAQKSLIESKEFSHPYYWAPVILTGDWR